MMMWRLFAWQAQCLHVCILNVIVFWNNSSWNMMLEKTHRSHMFVIYCMFAIYLHVIRYIVLEKWLMEHGSFVLYIYIYMKLDIQV